jgi:hypothetical protein
LQRHIPCCFGPIAACWRHGQAEGSILSSSSPIFIIIAFPTIITREGFDDAREQVTIFAAHTLADDDDPCFSLRNMYVSCLVRGSGMGLRHLKIHMEIFKTVADSNIGGSKSRLGYGRSHQRFVKIVEYSSIRSSAHQSCYVYEPTFLIPHAVPCGKVIAQCALPISAEHTCAVFAQRATIEIASVA